MAVDEHPDVERASTESVLAHRSENRQLRAAFLAGAEERSRVDFARGLTEQALLRIIWRYPGDIPPPQEHESGDHADL